MAPRVSESRRAVVLLVALAVAIATRAGAASCAADCVRRMADCRTEQCTGLSARACRDRCRAVTGCRAGGARIRTLATVVSTCQVREGQWTSTSRLEIKRGDCAPTTVLELASGSVPDATAPDTTQSICESYGLHRDGAAAVTVIPFQRLGVSPDGRTVLFELNSHVAEPTIPAPPFAVSEEGIFAVHADGSVRKVTSVSREKSYRYYNDERFGSYVAVGAVFSFSPNSRFAAFSDRGPGEDGSDAAQVIVLDLETDERTQVTRFNRPPEENTRGSNVTAFFLDDETLAVFSWAKEAYFLVARDGTSITRIPSIQYDVGGGTIAATFALAGPAGATTSLPFPNRFTELPVKGPVIELFAYARPDRLLQLTSFGRGDTLAGPSLTTGDHVFFLASTNALGRNPLNACQLFSIDRLGGRMRQLTTFDPGVPSTYGCQGGALPPECRVSLTSAPQFDVKTGTLVFDATCDPSGLRPVSGQVFAMRGDGSGLRQLTSYRGTQGTAADGTLTVELPGPIEYSGVKN